MIEEEKKSMSTSNKVYKGHKVNDNEEESDDEVDE